MRDEKEKDLFHSLEKEHLNCLVALSFSLLIGEPVPIISNTVVESVQWKMYISGTQYSVNVSYYYHSYYVLWFLRILSLKNLLSRNKEETKM